MLNEKLQWEAISVEVVEVLVEEDLVALHVAGAAVDRTNLSVEKAIGPVLNPPVVTQIFHGATNATVAKLHVLLVRAVQAPRPTVVVLLVDIEGISVEDVVVRAVAGMALHAEQVIGVVEEVAAVTSEDHETITEGLGTILEDHVMITEVVHERVATTEAGVVVLDQCAEVVHLG